MTDSQGRVAELTQRGKVAWADTDASGRIHFTAPFRWAEQAEHALHATACPPVDMGRFPRRTVEATYHSALCFGDEYDLRLRPERVGRSSVTYVWQVVSSGQIAVEGRHTIVHVDETGRSAPLPEQLRAGLGEPSHADS